MGIHLTCRLDTGDSYTRNNGICFSVLSECYSIAVIAATRNRPWTLGHPDYSFDIELGLGEGSRYYSERTLEQRKANDAHFDLLFGKLMAGKIITKKDGRSGVTTMITFLGSKCSVFEMIIATGVYRCWHDYPQLWEMWDKLEDYNLAPWVRMAVVSSLNLNRGEPTDLSCIKLRSNSQHMPIPTGIFDDNVVKMLMSGKFPKTPPMTYVAREEGGLGFIGRDSFLSGRKYTTSGSTSENYSFIKSQVGAGSYIRKVGEENTYSGMQFIVDLHSFINQVIIPKFGGTVV